ncbi:MAG: caspase family protein [Nanoarchaeota archaeon]|nr:caspase family protein [Nanoarchaeota archaeon]
MKFIENLKENLEKIVKGLAMPLVLSTSMILPSCSAIRLTKAVSDAVVDVATYPLFMQPKEDPNIKYGIDIVHHKTRNITTYPEAEQEKYAVIVVGDSLIDPVFDIHLQHSFWHRPFLVKKFLENQGYKKKNIEIFFDYGLTNVNGINSKPATKSKIEKHFKTLESRIDGNDTLFVYFGGHGHYGIGTEKLTGKKPRIQLKSFGKLHKILYNPSINLDEIKEMLRKVYPKEMMLVFSSCYGGDFASRLNDLNKKITAVSFSAPKQALWDYAPPIPENVSYFGSNSVPDYWNNSFFLENSPDGRFFMTFGSNSPKSTKQRLVYATESKETKKRNRRPQIHLYGGADSNKDFFSGEK